MDEALLKRCSGGSIDLAAACAPNTIADLFSLSQRAVREAVNAKRIPSHGEKRKSVIVNEFLVAAEQLPRCSCTGCHLPALGNNNSCGTRGHASRGKPKPADQVQKVAASRARRKMNRLNITEASARLHTTPRHLRRRHDLGEIDAVPGPGRAVYFDLAELERIEGDAGFRCKRCGDRIALAESQLCQPCASAQVQRDRVRSPAERRKMSASARGNWSDARRRAQAKATRARFANPAEKEAAANRLAAKHDLDQARVAADKGWTLNAIAEDLGRTIEHVRELARLGHLRARRMPGVNRLLLVSDKDYTRFRHIYLVGAEGGDWRVELLRELWRDPDFVVNVEEKSRRLADRARREGISLLEAAKRVRDEVAARNARLRKHRRGSRASASASPLQQARFEALCKIREDTAGQTLSRRRMLLMAAQLLAATHPKLLPEGAVLDGAVRPHYENAARAAIMQAEKACKQA